MKRFNTKYAPFWYHPDHLEGGTLRKQPVAVFSERASLSRRQKITNLDGEINQHMEYLPFGELLVEEHLNSYNSPFKFNAKEFDAETGNYYCGARYYDPKWVIWLSVDAEFARFPSYSPYNYTLLNPINLVDPDGNAPADWRNKNGKLVYDAKNGEYTKYATAQEKKYGNMLRNSGPTGAKKFNQLVTGEHKTYVEFHSGSKAFTLGHTESELNEEGNKLIKSKIDIYIGSVKEVKNDPTLLPNEEDTRIIIENNLSVDDIVTGVFGHEIDHDTVTNKLQRDKEERDGGSSGKFNSEYVPIRTQTKILQERANSKNDYDDNTGQ